MLRMKAKALLWVGGLMLIALSAPSFGNETDHVVLKVDLSIDGGAKLDAKSIKYSAFPGGKRCSFVYLGPKRTRTIKYMTEIGFKTTVYLSPKASAKSVKAYEDAGAEVAVSPWGCKGGYSSNIQGNTLQGTFDALTTSRLVLQKKANKPLLVGRCGGHISVPSFQCNRNFDSGVGYGAAYMDSHYLMAFDPTYGICAYLGYGRKPEAATRGLNNNTMNTRKVPNELIYYQILYGQFEGTLRRVQKGQVVRFSLRDFDAKDLEELKDNIGEFGKHPDIWHAGDGDIAAYEYVKKKVKVLGVNAGTNGTVQISLGVEKNTYPGFLAVPLSLELPAGTAVKKAVAASVACTITKRKEGVHVDIPIAKVLRSGCQMTFKTAAPDMTVPDEMGGKLTIKNTSKKPIEGGKLTWIGSAGLEGSQGLTVEGGTDKPITIAPNAEAVIDVKIKTAPNSRWGMLPIVAQLKAKVGGKETVLMEGFEIVVAPMLRVEMDPMNRIPMPKGAYQYFEIHLNNGKSESKLINHKAGACKGKLAFKLPEGMTAEPAELPFELKENEKKTLVVKVTNNQWGEKIVRVRPVLKLDGIDKTFETICLGTTVTRNQKRIDYKPLDDKGLLVQATWDDKTKGGRFDRSVGRSSSHYYPGHSPAYSPEGIKKWCMETARACQIYKTFKNVNHMAGTIMFYMKRDPKQRNELQVNANPATSWKQGVNRGNRGESLLVIGMTQRSKASNSGLVVRRYPGWGGKEGWLEVIYQCMGGRLYYLQAPYEKKRMYDWRHVAVVWDVKERRLELYLDGKLAGKADPGKIPWYTVPWDPGAAAGHPLIVHTTDHGHWCGTMKDEFYIYNRAMPLKEIQENRDLVKKK